MSNMNELVAAVRAHARANYNKGGWDEVVEAWDDADIVKEIGAARTAKGAIKKVGEMVAARFSYAEDIRGA